MRKIIERLIAILPAILLQILWYYIVYRILKDNNIALNIVKIIGMLLILKLIFEREESTYKILLIIIIIIMFLNFINIKKYKEGGKNEG